MGTLLKGLIGTTAKCSGVTHDNHNTFDNYGLANYVINAIETKEDYFSLY